MKSFEELNKELILIRYIGSEFGTMYFEPNVPHEKETIIRHLDGELTTKLLPVYVQLYDAVKQWVDSKCNIKEFLFIPDLVEVGKDYIIRPFFVYDIDVRDYFDEDEPIEPSKRYYEMISAFSKEMIISSGNEVVIERVLRKSLFGASGKTYFENKVNKFIIVEPKISIEDIKEWQLNNI